MKKLVALIVIVFAAIFYLYPTKKESIIEDSHVVTNASLESSSVEIFPFSNKKFASEKLQQLTMANEQCKESNLDFSSQVNNIHKILIQALEHELRNGKTERELLSYSSQYKTFYDRYDDLLLKAKINIEKEKYDFTVSVDILNDWHGLSVIKNFSTLNIPIIVQALKAFEGKSNLLSMNLELNTDISNSDILSLLENNENFNTYLESPLGISGSPVLSPSILFVLTAKSLSIDEFKQAISHRDFNVNDIAIAVINDLPFEYLEVLVKQTSSIGDMPTLVQGRFDSYANLADLASSEHNVKLLKLLEQYGVHPTNELGIITGLDIAIMHLPDKAESYLNYEDLPAKYIETINYLVSKGYKAHGSIYQIKSEDVISFRAPNRRSFQSSKVSEPNLKKALHHISLIDNSYSIEQLEPDNSIVSIAIDTMELRKLALNDKSKSCESIRKKLLAEEGFLDFKETYALIEKISHNEGNVTERLHDIDPALVNLWRNSPSNSSISPERNSKFVALLRQEKYQDAIDYSASTPLTEYETDTLLYLLVQDLESLAPIWNSRVTATPPSGLFVLKNTPIETWQSLATEGFDFSIKDKFGHDLFSPAALNSPRVVEFLLSMNIKPEMDSLGLDVMDLLLENTYETGKVNESLRLIITKVEKLEPNHYSRIARIKKFFPEEYDKLIKINRKFQIHNEVELNKFRLKVW